MAPGQSFLSGRRFGCAGQPGAEGGAGPELRSADYEGRRGLGPGVGPRGGHPGAEAGEGFGLAGPRSKGQAAKAIGIARRHRDVTGVTAPNGNFRTLRIFHRLQHHDLANARHADSQWAWELAGVQLLSNLASGLYGVVPTFLPPGAKVHSGERGRLEIHASVAVGIPVAGGPLPRPMLQPKSRYKVRRQVYSR